MSDRAIVFSFVIPTFNRALLVADAIRSAVAWLGGAKDGEIVVVDDCSVDGTVERIRREFGHEIENGLIRVLSLAKNGGVIRAKNAGARAASGRWLIFLDSDDLMIASAAGAMRAAFDANRDAPALFFRCEDLSTGTLLGAPQDRPSRYTLQDHLNQVSHGASYGECLPVVKRDVFEEFPYDESIDGWEGIAYARILRAKGPFVVIPIVARRYRTEGEDRLSSAAGLRRRARSIGAGHWILLKEFAPYFTVANLVRQVAKVGFYRFRTWIPKP